MRVTRVNLKLLKMLIAQYKILRFKDILLYGWQNNVLLFHYLFSTLDPISTIISFFKKPYRKKFI